MIFCPACHDAYVNTPRTVCDHCLTTDPDDWFPIDGYFNMVRLARANNQRPTFVYNEAQMILEGIPSFQPRRKEGVGL